jgi:hypothetical protein
MADSRCCLLRRHTQERFVPGTYRRVARSRPRASWQFEELKEEQTSKHRSFDRQELHFFERKNNEAITCSGFVPNTKEVLSNRQGVIVRGEFGPFAAAKPTTLEPPTRRKVADDDLIENDNKDKAEYPDMEYLIDSDAFRGFDDPFHILLMGSTFEKPKITVTYVAGSLEYVLNMPTDEGTELSKFAKYGLFGRMAKTPMFDAWTAAPDARYRVPSCALCRRWTARMASQRRFGFSIKPCIF